MINKQVNKKNNPPKKSQLLFLIGLIILIIVIVYLSIKQAEVNINQPEYTVCEIVPKEEGDKRVWFDAKFQYFVAGEKYSFLKTPNEDKFNVIGEKYVLEYDAENPEEHRVISYKPLFLKEEKTSFVKGNIRRVFKFKKFTRNGSIYAITFEYTVNERTYKKTQDLPPNYKELYPALKKGNQYKVEYWIKNPERSIIHLNQPK